MKKYISILLSITVVMWVFVAFSVSSNAVSKKTVKIKKNYKIGSTVILKYSGKRDIIRGSSKAKKKVNKSVNNIQEKYRKEHLAQAKTRYYENSSALPHTLILSLKAYESGKYYSFKVTTSGYYGGAHTGHEVYGYTYKKSTGKKVSALSVIKNKKKLLKSIKKAFYNQFEKKGSDPDYMCSWLGIDKSTLKSYTYYLNGKYIYANYNFGSNLWLTGTVKVKKC